MLVWRRARFSNWGSLSTKFASRLALSRSIKIVLLSPKPDFSVKFVNDWAFCNKSSSRTIVVRINSYKSGSTLSMNTRRWITSQMPIANKWLSAEPIPSINILWTWRHDFRQRNLSVVTDTSDARDGIKPRLSRHCSIRCGTLEDPGGAADFRGISKFYIVALTTDRHPGQLQVHATIQRNTGGSA